MRQLEVRLLGRFEVLVDLQPVPGDAWPHRRAADLVKLLALAPGHRMARDEVLEMLWPQPGRRRRVWAAAARERPAARPPRARRGQAGRAPRPPRRRAVEGYAAAGQLLNERRARDALERLRRAKISS